MLYCSCTYVVGTMYVQCKTLASGGVVDLAGNENHFEFRTGLVRADLDILDVGEAAFINE